MADKKSSQILLSSSLATTIIAVITNPLDVIKVRIQNGSKYCSLPNHSQCITQTPNNGPTASLQQASIFRLLAAKNIQEQYKILCDCVPFRSNTKALIYIIRKEGFRTLTNGMVQGMVGANLSMTTYFICYEGVRRRVKQFTSHPVAIPLASALIARTITTCVGFPFEYWRTLQQSVTGVNNKSGFQLGMRVNSGFFSLLQRDLLFSGLYWVLVENIRREVKSWRQHHDEGYLDKTNLFLSNLIAGSVSGAIAAAVTLPLDIVKTRRQLHPDEYKKRSTFSVLKEIYHNEGKDALTAGMRQRVTRVTIACAGILTLYEFFSDILKGDVWTSLSD